MDKNCKNKVYVVIETNEDGYGEDLEIDDIRVYGSYDDARAGVSRWADDIIKNPSGRWSDYHLEEDTPLDFSLWCNSGPDYIFRYTIKKKEIM